VAQLVWSGNGERLVAIAPRHVFVYSATGRLLSTQRLPGGTPITAGALSPDGHTLAFVLGGASSAVVVENLGAFHPVERRVLAGSGLGQLAWSPHGRWLLVSWPAANQWVFVRVMGRPRISAVSRIVQQFSAGVSTWFPQLEGWCCSAAGAAR
jgi:hypothetical protein